jgi:NADH-quinone oxidoreductase subunit E
MKTLSSKELVDEVRSILGRHRPERAALVPILQQVQAKFSYLPREAMLEAAHFLRIPTSTVYGVATFYNEFRFVPLGKRPVKVCMGTACHMRGGTLVLDALERELGIKVGDVTPDGEYSLDRVACVGCCVMAPVAVIGENVHPRLTSFKVEEVLANIKQDSAQEEPPE